MDLRALGWIFVFAGLAGCGGDDGGATPAMPDAGTSAVAASAPGVKAGRLAVVGIEDAEMATERVWLVLETDATGRGAGAQSPPVIQGHGADRPPVAGQPRPVFVHPMLGHRVEIFHA